MQADEALGPRACTSQPRDRQGGCVGRNDGARAEHRFGFARDLRFQFALLKHRFDDQIAVAQIINAGGGNDAIQHGLRIGHGHPALLDPLGKQATAHIPTRRGLFQGNVFQYTRYAPAGAGPGDSGPHHACAQYADPVGFPACWPSRTTCARLEFVHLEEERTDHVFCHLTGCQAREPSRFNAHGGVEVDLRAFHGARHDGAGGRVIALCFLLQHGRRDGQHRGNCRVGWRAAGNAPLRIVPRLPGRGIGRDPRACGGQQQVGGGHGGMDQTGSQRLGGLHAATFAQDGESSLKTHQPDCFGDAACSGQESESDFGETDLDARIVDAHPVMAGKRQFQTASQGTSTQGCNHWPAELLETPKRGLECLKRVIERRSVLRLHRNERPKIATCEEGAFCRGEDDAGETLAFAFQAGDHRGQIGHEGGAHHVDRLPGRIKDKGGDTVGAVLKADGGHSVWGWVGGRGWTKAISSR